MNLIPTHNRLRDIWTFKHFVRQFQRGIDIDNFGQVPIVVTEDDCCYIWDCHHRLAAMTYLGLRVPLSVITIHHYTYKQLLEINFAKGYVTPFDPRKECRLSFHEYKDTVLGMYKEAKNKSNRLREDSTDDIKVIEKYIHDNENLYKEGRDVTSLHGLIPEEFKKTAHSNKWS